MTLVVLIAGVAFGFFLARWLAARRPGRKPGRSDSKKKPVDLLLQYTGETLQLQPAKLKDSVVVADGVEYPLGVLRAFEFDSGVLYVASLSKIAIGDQRELQKARQPGVYARLTRSNSDMQYYLSLAAWLVPIIVSVYWYSRIGEMNTLLLQAVSNTNTLRDVVTQPLQILPAGAPAATPFPPGFIPTPTTTP